MKLSSSVLDLDLPEIEKRIRRFIKEYVENAGVEGIVVGLSGGIDSGTIAALSSLAIGGKRVLGLLLPEKETYNPKDIDDAKFVAEKFGLQTQVCDITPALEAFYKTIPIFNPAEKLCKGNIKARARMIYLYYYANKLNRIVCGSSDKSETMMGYFTKWGDPAELAEKPSTPALWPNQFAETELGIKYETLDLILYGLERFMTIEDIAQQLSVEQTLVEKVKSRWLSAEHKRRVLLTSKLEYRTVGTDFRLPRAT
jgi:NAD+ synthase